MEAFLAPRRSRAKRRRTRVSHAYNQQANDAIWRPPRSGVAQGEQVSILPRQLVQPAGISGASLRGTRVPPSEASTEAVPDAVATAECDDGSHSHRKVLLLIACVRRADNRNGGASITQCAGILGLVDEECFSCLGSVKFGSCEANCSASENPPEIRQLDPAVPTTHKSLDDAIATLQSMIIQASIEYEVPHVFCSSSGLEGSEKGLLPELQARGLFDYDPQTQLESSSIVGLISRDSRSCGGTAGSHNEDDVNSSSIGAEGDIGVSAWKEAAGLWRVLASRAARAALCALALDPERQDGLHSTNDFEDLVSSLHSIRMVNDEDLEIEENINSTDSLFPNEAVWENQDLDSIPVEREREDRGSELAFGATATDGAGSQWIRGARVHVARKEQFLIKTGPLCARPRTPFDAFLWCWLAVEELVVVESNRYAELRRARLIIAAALRWWKARRSRPRQEFQRFALPHFLERDHWKEITAAELRQFIGLHILYSSYGITASRSDWWNERAPTHWSLAVETFSRARFQFVARHLHFSDSHKEVRRDHCGYDPLFKIRAFGETLFTKFNALYSIHQAVTVDEMEVKFRNHVRFATAHSREPAVQHGLRVLAAIDQETSYMANCSVLCGDYPERAFYAQLDVDAETRLSLGSMATSIAVVTQPYWNTHRIVNCDQEFTSVDLFSFLLQRGIYACGVTNGNRRGFPRNVLLVDRLAAFPRGSTAYAAKGEMFALAWKDSDVVCALSTCSSTSGYDGSARPFGGEVGAVARPLFAQTLTRRMREIDFLNQMNWKFSTGHGDTSHWWLHMFYWFLDVMLNNALVIYRHWDSKMNMRAFRASVGAALVRSGTSHDDAPAELRQQERHLLVPVSAKIPRANCNRTPQRRCIVCSTERGKESRTTSMCEKCKAPLCSMKSGRDCFEKFHSDLDFWTEALQHASLRSRSGGSRRRQHS